MKNIRKRSISIINFETNIEPLIEAREFDLIHDYFLNIETEVGEKEVLHIQAPCKEDAINCAERIISSGSWGFKGIKCVSIDIKEE